MDKAISRLRKAWFLELRKLSQIREYFSENTTKKLALALVLNKIDYFNSLFVNLPDNK